VAPVFADDARAPESVTFTGQLFGETRLLALAQAWQSATGHHRRHPEPRD
jgi:Asp-tRNA(Asn)/Glu-tRNA(Gln) amidotransferase A subunit family amidase